MCDANRHLLRLSLNCTDLCDLNFYIFRWRRSSVLLPVCSRNEVQTNFRKPKVGCAAYCSLQHVLVCHHVL